jgi:hypothetical protein
MKVDDNEGWSGGDRATISPNDTVSMIHLSVVQQGKPTHPSPSARQF